MICAQTKCKVVSRVMVGFVTDFESKRWDDLRTWFLLCDVCSLFYDQNWLRAVEHMSWRCAANDETFDFAVVLSDMELKPMPV